MCIKQDTLHNQDKIKYLLDKVIKDHISYSRTSDLNAFSFEMPCGMINVVVSDKPLGVPYLSSYEFSNSKYTHYIYLIKDSFPDFTSWLKLIDV